MSKQESFPVLSIDRENVNQVMGYTLGDKLSNNQMRKIASRFNDALMTPQNWSILADVVKSAMNTSTIQGTITIEVESGVVRAVTGLPEGYDYKIIDHD